MITNQEQFDKALISEIRKAIKEIAETIAEQLTENIQNRIYNRPPSKYYKRTEEFINSVIEPNVIVSGNSVSVVLGMNPNAMNSYWNNEGLFNSHMSIDGSSTWGSKSVAEGLVAWWDSGTDNKYLPSIPATNYWYDVFGGRGGESPNYEKLDNLINEIMSKHLKKFGKIL